MNAKMKKYITKALGVLETTVGVLAYAKGYASTINGVADMIDKKKINMNNTSEVGVGILSLVMGDNMIREGLDTIFD